MSSALGNEGTGKVGYLGDECRSLGDANRRFVHSRELSATVTTTHSNNGTGRPSILASNPPMNHHRNISSGGGIAGGSCWQQYCSHYKQSNCPTNRTNNCTDDSTNLADWFWVAHQNPYECTPSSVPSVPGNAINSTNYNSKGPSGACSLTTLLVNWGTRARMKWS